MPIRCLATLDMTICRERKGGARCRDCTIDLPPFCTGGGPGKWGATVVRLTADICKCFKIKTLYYSRCLAALDMTKVNIRINILRFLAALETDVLCYSFERSEKPE